MNRLAGVRNAKVSPAGTVAASTSEGTIAFYDVSTLRGTGQPITGVGDVDQFAFSDDGRLLVARGRDGRVLVVDMTQHALLGDPIPIQGSLDDERRPQPGRKRARACPIRTASSCGSSEPHPG